MTTNTSNLQEKNQQVLKNITALQAQEKQLYDSLNNTSLSTEERQQIINKINEISQIRMNMYLAIKNVYSLIEDNVDASIVTIQQQIKAIDVLENELNETKIKMNLLEDQKNNKLRLVEINTYYGKQYNSKSSLMKLIIMICIPIILLSVLYNVDILPTSIYSFLVGLILVIGVFLIGSKLIDIFNRDNMNWDEYDWYFDKNSAPGPDYTGSASSSGYSDPWETATATCVGSACCYANTTYDPEQNICVPNNLYAKSANTTETLSVLSKYGNEPIKTSQLNQTISPIYSSLNNF
jgi:hypothetical protein